MKNKTVLVFGGSGLVGSAIIRNLKSKGYTDIVAPRSSQLNLLVPSDVCAYVSEVQPETIVMAAAKVGGIAANMREPADFGYVNGMMTLNVINCAFKNKIPKLLYLGSSCIYPRMCQQPMVEESLMQGPCEPTNEMYALSKIYGLKLCEAYNKQYGTNFIAGQPCNIYGQGDHFEGENTHVIGALISKFHKAKINNDPTVTVWGGGTVKREFLYVDDCADACVFLLENYNESQFINIGSGEDLTMRELAETIKEVVGFNGQIVWDINKPEGMPRKVLDVSRINKLGWKHKINLKEGLIKTYEWYCKGA